MTYILQKKNYLFCQFSLKYVALILFFSFIPSERDAAYHNFFQNPWVGGAAPNAPPLATPLQAAEFLH